MSNLAIDGGTPIREKPISPWPTFPEEAAQAVAAVVRSGKVNYHTGQEARTFEREFAEACGCEYGIGLANGTLALEMALRALGIGAGDDVVVTSRTFIASASSVAMIGARPVMADVDRDSQTVTAETIRAALTPQTKAIIAVHLAGWPCDMDPILELAVEEGLKVVEDCAQAHGAKYNGQPVGSMGDIGAYSFCQDKIMTTGGEGGAVVTNDVELYEWMWGFKDHGKSYDAVFRRQHAPGFRWQHESFGTNWRMTEMHGAVGRVLLPLLPEWVEKRRENAGFLAESFNSLEGLRTPMPGGEIYHSFYKFYTFVRPEKLKEGWDRDRVMNAIAAEGIPGMSGSCSEIYLEKAFDGLRPAEPLPVARELGETSLMFMVHPTLPEEDLADTWRAVEKVMEAATV